MTSDERSALIQKYRVGYQIVQGALDGATPGELDSRRRLASGRRGRSCTISRTAR